jgi:esterase/lipase superfamily enzyme
MPAPRIQVRFATNRNRVAGDDLFGDGFEGGDAKRYVTGSIDAVRLSNLPDTGWAPLAETLAIDPPTAKLVQIAGTLPGATPATGLMAFAEEQAQAKAGAAAAGGAAAAAASSFGLVLLPGFASTFLDAIRRAAQVAFAYKAANVFCFSWPANGRVNLSDYREDRRDAERSGQAIADALAQFLAKIRQMPAAQRPRIHVVCHSMGAFAFRAAVQAIQASHPELTSSRAFEGVLLMAADEDDDALSDQARLAPLLKLAGRVTVYTAGGDLALAVAQLVNGVPRLGHGGPRNLASFPKTVTRVDCSDVAITQGDHGETHFGHQYYRLSPRVIADVVQVIAGKAPNQVAGRLPHPAGPAGGRNFILPFDSGAATIPASAAPHPLTAASLVSAKATGKRPAGQPAPTRPRRRAGGG